VRVMGTLRGILITLLAPVMAGGFSSVAAQTPSHREHADRVITVRGILTALGPGKMQVQSMMGAALVPFDASTQVVKIVYGTTADLVPRTRVVIHLSSQSRMVIAIRVTASLQAQPHLPWAHDGTGTPGVRPRPLPASTPVAPRPLVRNRGTVRGNIVAVGDGVVAVRTGKRTVNFALSPGATITKSSMGTLSDLAVGEMVQVLVPVTGPALRITILQA
jgi:hypothetical protein